MLSLGPHLDFRFCGKGGQKREWSGWKQEKPSERHTDFVDAFKKAWNQSEP